MERFKIFEQWIGRKANSLKGVLAILWVVWAVFQVTGASFSHRLEVFQANVNKFDLEMEKRASQELRDVYGHVWDEAKAKGEQYGPKDYFAHMRLMDEARYDIRKKYPDARGLSGDGGFLQKYPTDIAGFLQDCMKPNLARGYFTEKELAESRNQYAEWKDKGDGAKIDIDDGLLKKADFSLNNLRSVFHSVLNWFLTLYLRTLLLVPLWYLLQMCQRKGILETILADKKKFVRSIFAWPVDIWRYPANVLREIRVEAELRRMGKLFRRLGEKEKELVRKIANSDEYGEWLIRHQRKNRGRFRHGLLVALAATLIVVAVAPAFGSGPSLSGPTEPHYELQHDGHGDQGTIGVPHWSLPTAIQEVCLRGRSTRLAVANLVFTLQEVLRRIEHVPLSGSLVGKEGSSIN